MGTKNNPGKFDCYENAEPDEPMFVLLARDPAAPTLVRNWADHRLLNGEDTAMVNEALNCADAMEVWFMVNRPGRMNELDKAEVDLRT